MKLHDFINNNIGNVVVVTDNGDFSMSSSLVGKEFILKRLTKGGMAIISDKKGKEYSVPPKNINHEQNT